MQRGVSAIGELLVFRRSGSYYNCAYLRKDGQTELRLHLHLIYFYICIYTFYIRWCVQPRQHYDALLVANSHALLCT